MSSRDHVELDGLTGRPGDGRRWPVGVLPWRRRSTAEFTRLLI
jgi:hypothetical protein